MTATRRTWLLIATAIGCLAAQDALRGTLLSGAQGRFRLVAANDKPGARSLRMLTRLEVVQLRK